MSKMNLYTTLGLVLIFLGGIGGILLAIGQAKSASIDKVDIINTTKSENLGLKNQIIELKDERNKLSKMLETRDEKIQEQNENIQSLSNRLIEKAEHNEDFISGANRYPHVEIKKVSDDKNQNDVFLFSIENSFKLPIYNIDIQAFDYDKIIALAYDVQNGNKKAIKMDDYLGARLFEYKTQEIPQGQYRMSPEQFTQKHGAFFINISSRGNHVIQKIVLIQKEGNTYAGYNIIDIKGNVIKEYIYNNPPEQLQGEIRMKLKKVPDNLDLIFTK